MAKTHHVGRGGKGARGARGLAGKTGKTGSRGPTGAQGPKMQRADVLEMVADQFAEARRALDTQVVRMAQIQQQIDEIHATIK